MITKKKKLSDRMPHTAPPVDTWGINLVATWNAKACTYCLGLKVVFGYQLSEIRWYMRKWFLVEKTRITDWYVLLESLAIGDCYSRLLFEREEIFAIELGSNSSPRPILVGVCRLAYHYLVSLEDKVSKCLTGWKDLWGRSYFNDKICKRLAFHYIRI